MDNVSRVSACNPYRGLRKGESEEEYVLRLQAELEAEFQRVGPHKVAAFVVEPIVGTVSVVFFDTLIVVLLTDHQ
jgi:adenosylmethionine-8-amino-7-oxononanoate aminotransferase